LENETPGRLYAYTVSKEFDIQIRVLQAEQLAFPLKKGYTDSAAQTESVV